ncbi:MAG: ECF transporter S component [Clostridia bacterium]|nr:ECF transporter S component [Clostridia bacterium]
MQTEQKTSDMKMGRATGKRLKKLLSAIIIFIAIPAVIAVGVVLFKDRKYNLISMIIAFLSCVPFFLLFKKRKPQAREIICIAVMSAISVAGRLVFAMLPGFKPVTAITAITGIAFGPEVGFLTGAISAIVSNMFFGQGPWTPFQMMSWGILGFIAGLLARAGIMENKIVLSIYGVVSGILYSLMMDIWFVISIDGLFTWDRYIIAIASAVPFMIVYSVSNVVFLLVLSEPIGKKLKRVKTKYGLMQ